ncbi:MAG: hypothetical protein R3E96_15000 [Planctomycetota bacterium]
MKTFGMNLEPARTRLVLAGALLALSGLSACDSSNASGEMRRQAPTSVGRGEMVPAGVTPEMRFGSRSMTPPAGHDAAAAQGSHALPEFEYDLPDTWKQIARTDIRLLNFSVQGDSGATCYLSVLGGSVEGIRDNVDRWRRQFGLPAITDEELAGLPTLKLFGEVGPVVSASGPFADGMGGEIADAGLRGLIVHRGGALAFLKLVGPREVVGAEAANFDRFAESLNLPTAPTVEPSQSGASLLTVVAPPEWKVKDPGSVRLYSYEVGDGGDLSVMFLPGEAGGVPMNINRWRGQVGLDAAPEAELLAGERMTVLGEEGWWVDLEGSYKGMGTDVLVDKAGLIGVVVPMASETLFVKLAGPLDVVQAEKERVRAYIQSFQMGGQQ